MAYATVEELAAALRIAVTDANREGLQTCLDAAAIEIDDTIDLPDGAAPIDPGNPLANRVNIVRALEWWKSNDAAFGVLGSTDLGPVRAPKDSFARHALELVPLKAQWGVA
jgi:hypothetical protein